MTKPVTMPTPMEFLRLFGRIYELTEYDPTITAEMRDIHARLVALQHRIAQTDPRKVAEPRQSMADGLRAISGFVGRLDPNGPFPYRADLWDAERDRIVALLDTAAGRVIE